MSDITSTEDRLGIRLPASYVEGVEDCGISDTPDYHLYTLDELCWLRDHQDVDALAKLDHEALVIGDDDHGNVLVLLGFEVVGIPTLSDEVYLVGPDGLNADPVALDLFQLLDQAPGNASEEPEMLSMTAFAVTATLDEFTSALREALEARGYGPPPVAFDRGGEYLDIAIGGVGGPSLVASLPAGDVLWLARRLATLLARPVRACSVMLRAEPVKAATNEWEFPVTPRVVDIGSDGVMADREPAFDEATANFGDLHETVSAVLWQLIDHPPGRTVTMEYYRPAPPADLSARLMSLLGVIAESNTVELTEIAGQQAVRIELPDGSRQISVVTDDELAALRKHGGL